MTRFLVSPYWILSCVLGLTAMPACDADGSDATMPLASAAAAGTVSIGAEEGVDFSAGSKVTKANFTNADVIATASSGHLKLAPGGEIDSPKATTYRAVNWFLSESSGIHATFDDLASVPATRPSDDTGSALTNPKEGNAFVIQSFSGTWFKARFSAVSDTSLTIEFEPLPD